MWRERSCEQPSSQIAYVEFYHRCFYVQNTVRDMLLIILERHTGNEKETNLWSIRHQLYFNVCMSVLCVYVYMYCVCVYMCCVCVRVCVCVCIYMLCVCLL